VTGRLLETQTGRVVARRVARAAGPLARLAGLLGRRHLDPDEGMWFDRCGAIHTLGMTIAIDVVFLDRDGVVLAVASDVEPWRLSIGARGARNVVELAAGTCARTGLVAAMRLEMRWGSR
jgi:hypothetical protein